MKSCQDSGGGYNPESKCCGGTVPIVLHRTGKNIIMVSRYLRPSSRNPHYLEDASGKTFLPVGLNLCFFRNSEQFSEAEVLEKYRFWMEKFACNGGNFIRVWLGVPFFNVMPERVGVYQENALNHIRTIVKWGEELGIKIKFTLEHFRSIQPQKNVESYPGAADFTNPVYARANGGPCDTIEEFCTLPEARAAFLGKLRYLAASGVGDSPAVVAWELWNEINCLAPVAVYGPWSKGMLRELQQLFPRQLILQSLGSFSDAGIEAHYDLLAETEPNDLLQVHRYLDPGASMDICRGPMDLLCADAIRELHDRRNDKPAILAESGATEAHHRLYSHLYAFDQEGVLLHDLLFAPFFSGSAGSGQPWHWDHLYLERHDLFWQFAQFVRAVKSVDPIAEEFRPFHTETHQLRIYGLRGRRLLLLWCRDKSSNWSTEIEHDRPAPVLQDCRIPAFGGGSAESYSPWTEEVCNLTAVGDEFRLPEFRRSLVVRIQR